MGSALFDGLLDDRFELAYGPIDAAPSVTLVDAEEHAIAGAVEKRRREFKTGRLFARQALARLGCPDATIPAGPDRAPVWPAGVVGSISHSSDLCVVAVAKCEHGVASVGLDIERLAPLGAELWDTVMTVPERAQLPTAHDFAPGVLEMVVFSAKEATYKCQYPLSREFLEFLDLTVSLDTIAMTFVSSFNKSAGPFSAGDQLAGQWRIAAGHIATAVVFEQG